MRKLFFSALLILSTTCYSQIKLSALVGYNDANLLNFGRLSFNDGNNYGLQYSPIKSYHFGATMEIPLGKKWFLESGLSYFGNGTHISEKYFDLGFGPYVNFSMNLYYLRIPINFLYKIYLGNSVSVFVGTGLYFARGIRGKEKREVDPSINGAPIDVADSKIKFGKETSVFWDNLTFNPYDLGYTFLAGVEWKKFRLMPSISNGLIKAYGGIWAENYLWNTAFSVSLTYNFYTISK
jgi:hypothetical protein